VTALASRFDHLSTDELFRLLRRTEDPYLRQQLREHLVRRHEGLVRHVVKDYADAGESYEDLYSVGLLGLLNAVDRFDPDRGTRFATFAVPTIRGEVRRYFRDKTWRMRVPRSVQELSLRARALVERYTQTHGRAPTYEQLARQLGVTEEEVIEALEVSSQYEPTSIDQPAADAEEEDVLAAGERAGAPDPEIEALAERDRIWRALQHLPPRERVIIALRYFAGLSQQEVGRRLGISQMHVSRLQHRALARLRSLLSRS
jgi:RNA polymerase sigma-B factor